MDAKDAALLILGGIFISGSGPIGLGGDEGVIKPGSSVNRRAPFIIGRDSGAGGDKLSLASIGRLSIVGGRKVGTEGGSRFPTAKLLCCRSARDKGKRTRRDEVRYHSPRGGSIPRIANWILDIEGRSAGLICQQDSISSHIFGLISPAMDPRSAGDVPWLNRTGT